MTVYKLKTVGGEENGDCQWVHVQIELLITWYLVVFAYLKKNFFHPWNSFSLFYKVKIKNLDFNGQVFTKLMLTGTELL